MEGVELQRKQNVFWNQGTCTIGVSEIFENKNHPTCESFLHDIDKWLEVDLPAWEQCAQVTCLPLCFSASLCLCSKQSHNLSPLFSQRIFFFCIFHRHFHLLWSSLACFCVVEFITIWHCSSWRIFSLERRHHNLSLANTFKLKFWCFILFI